MQCFGVPVVTAQGLFRILPSWVTDQASPVSGVSLAGRREGELYQEAAGGWVGAARGGDWQVAQWLWLEEDPHPHTLDCPT